MEQTSSRLNSRKLPGSTSLLHSPLHTHLQSLVPLGIGVGGDHYCPFNRSGLVASGLPHAEPAEADSSITVILAPRADGDREASDSEGAVTS